FFNGLRGLAQDGLALVTATRHPLYDLCRDKKFAGSQFWNLFQSRTLGPYEPQEAEQFITLRFADAGQRLTPEECVRLIRTAGRYPHFLQRACYFLYAQKTGEASDWEADFKEDIRPHLCSLWDDRTPQEQEILIQTLQRRLRKGNSDLLQRLENL